MQPPKLLLGNPVHANSISYLFDYWNDVINLTADDISYTATGSYYVPINYTYYAQVQRMEDGSIIGVTIDPITADPMSSVYVDAYGSKEKYNTGTSDPAEHIAPEREKNFPKT